MEEKTKRTHPQMSQMDADGEGRRKEGKRNRPQMKMIKTDQTEPPKAPADPFPSPLFICG